MKKIIINGGPFLFPPSGLKNFTVNFIRNLSKKLNHINFEILVPEKLEGKDFSLEKNCNFVHIPKIKSWPKKLWFLPWDFMQVFEYIKEQNPNDIVFFLSTHHAFLLQKLNLPEFIILHDIQFLKNPEENWPIQNKLAYEIIKHAIPNADMIFTVSDFTKREVESFFKLTDTPVISIYEDINEYFKQNLALDNDYLNKRLKVNNLEYFLYIGSFEPRKNVHFLLQAYQEYLKRSKIRKPLVVVGYYLARSKKILKLTFGKNVIRYDKLDLFDVYQLYKGAYAFIYPSQYEGFGLQVLEAQNIGCPLLLSNIKVFQEIAGNGALFFDLDHLENLVEKMLYLEEYPKARLKLIDEGKKNALRFSWEQTIDIFLKSLAHRNYI